MNRILVIDNNIDTPGCADIVRCLEQAQISQAEYSIEVYRGPENKIPKDLEAVCGVVLSGSKTRVSESAAWIDTQLDFLALLHKEKIPTLGICYGEQLMARAFLGTDFVDRGERPEFGFVEIECTDLARQSKIMQGLASKFYTFCYRYDEVQNVEDKFIVTARSERCAIHAFDVPEAPMWGVQFHPERNLAEAYESIAEIKKQNPNCAILGDGEIDSLYDPRVGATIFKNFLAEVRSYCSA